MIRIIRITVNEPGTTTLADARPMVVNGEGVYVTIEGGIASLHVDGAIAAQMDADDMTITEAQAWAVEYRNAMNEMDAAACEEALDRMVEAWDREKVYVNAALTVREDGAAMRQEADRMAADTPAGPYRYYSQARDKFITYPAHDPRHPLNAAKTMKRDADVLMAWTAADEMGYMAYISDGVADTDGYFIPLLRESWKTSQS